ncbi:MAG: queuosine precursor transporter [Anaerolineaceae bacterium]|nr:queuosine precursor transporter [Anaerolineaceae bacterium]
MVSVILVSVAYIAAQMLADISSLKIVTFAGLSMDAGTFIYPITFTLRDMVHKVAGIKAARILIVAAAVVNIFMAIFFAFVSNLPGDPNVGDQSAFAIVLSPVWRLVLASIVAEVISELIDTEAYRIWTTKITKKFQWARVLVSNSFSVPIDSIVFSWLAFSGSMPNAVVWSIVLSNILVKGITTLVGMPLIYLVKEKNE